MTAPRHTRMAVAAAAVSAALVAGMTGTAIAFEDVGGGPDEPADPIACVPRPRPPSASLHAVVWPHLARTATPGPHPTPDQPATTPPVAVVAPPGDLHRPAPLDVGTGTGCTGGLGVVAGQGMATAGIPAPRRDGRYPEVSGE